MKKFVKILLVCAAGLCLMAVGLYGCIICGDERLKETAIEQKENTAENLVDRVYFSNGNSIYAFKEGEVKKLIDTDLPGTPKYIENNKLIWISGHNCINIYNTESSALETIETHYDIYDYTYTERYVIFSGFDNVRCNYVICLKDISTGEEICVSDTQNNTVTFAYYNDEIYFLEPNDDNHLYKYNVTLQEKSLVSDLVANKSSVRMSLFVCEQGIFYTKAIFYETGREQHLLYKLRDGEIIKIADDVDNIIGLIKNNIYVDSLSGIYEINLDNMEKNQLMKDSDFINTYMQSHYLICETLNLTDEEKDTVYIYDIDRKQLAATVRPSDL